MNIGDIVYVTLTGYNGVYVVSGKIGDRIRLSKPTIPGFTLVVAKNKINKA